MGGSNSRSCMWLAEYYKRRGLFVLFGSFLVRKLLIKTAYATGVAARLILMHAVGRESS